MKPKDLIATTMILGGFMLVLLASIASAASVCALSPLPRKTADVIEMRLKSSTIDNAYLRAFQHQTTFFIERQNSNLLATFQIYYCALMDPGMEENDFTFAMDKKLTHVWILTEDPGALSKLYKKQDIPLPKRPKEIMNLALEAWTLTRANYKFCIPLENERLYKKVIDTSKAKTKFKAFSVGELNRGGYKVSGLFLIGNELLRRTIVISRTEIGFIDKVLETKVNKIHSLFY